MGPGVLHADVVAEGPGVFIAEVDGPTTGVSASECKKSLN